MSEIEQTVRTRLRGLRRAQSLSLDDLAELDDDDAVGDVGDDAEIVCDEQDSGVDPAAQTQQ